MADMQDDVDMSTLTDSRDTSEMDWEPAPTPSTRCKRTLDDLYESSAVENSPSKRMRNVRRTLRPLPKRAACSMVQLINNAIRHGPRSTARFVRNIPYTVSTIHSGVPRVGTRIYNRFFPQRPASIAFEVPPMPGSFPVTPQRPHPQTLAEVSTVSDNNTSSVPNTYTVDEAHPSRRQSASTPRLGHVEPENENTRNSTSINLNTTTSATQTDEITNDQAHSQVPAPAIGSSADSSASNANIGTSALQHDEDPPTEVLSPSPNKIIAAMPTPDPGPGYHAWAGPVSQPKPQPKRIRVARDSPLEGQALFERQPRVVRKISKSRVSSNNADMDVSDVSPTLPYNYKDARARAARHEVPRARYTKPSNAFLTAEERAKTRPVRPALEERNLNVFLADVPDSPLARYKDSSSRARVDRAEDRMTYAEMNRRRAAEKKQADVAARIARVESGFAQRAKETAEARAKRYAEAEAEEKAKAEAEAEAKARTEAEKEARAQAEAEAKIRAEVAEKTKAEAEAEAKAKAEAEEQIKAEAEAETKAKAAKERSMMRSSAPTLRLKDDVEEPLPDVLSPRTIRISRANMDLYHEYNREANELRNLRDEDPDASMIDATPPPKLKFHPGSAWWAGWYPADLNGNIRHDDIHPWYESFPSNIREFDNTLPVTDIGTKQHWGDTPRLKQLRPEDAGVAASPATTDASPTRLPNHPADSPMIRPFPQPSKPSRTDQIRADAGVAASPAITDASPNSDPKDSGNETPSKSTEPARGGGPTTPARQTGTSNAPSQNTPQVETPIQGITDHLRDFFFTPSKSSGGRAQAVEASRAQARRESERQAAIKAEKERKKLEEQRKKDEAERRARASIIVKLTPDMEKSVDGAMAASGMTKQCGMVTRKDLGTLLPQNSGEGIGWLNDEIVNKYLDLVVDRAREKAGNPKASRESGPVRFKNMGSFMYTQYTSKKQQGVEQFRSWNRRPKIADEGLLQCEKVLIPINNNSHWTLLVVSPPSRTITFYDSLGGAGSQYTSFALDWVKMTMGSHFVADDWKIVASRSSRQMNGLDCGVFVCMNGMAVCRGVEPTDAFDDRSVKVARRQIAATLIGGGFKGALAW